jgi:hypothetical protein
MNSVSGYGPDDFTNGLFLVEGRYDDSYFH